MELKMLSMKKIVTNPLQPRQVFDQEKLKELSNSIKEGELLQPIVVRPNGGDFEIVAGERRYKAFQILKESKIPAIVRNISDDTDALEKSLIENLQRDDLTSVERENAIWQLWESKRYKNHSDLARKLGVDKSGVSHIIGSKEDRDKLGVSPNISTGVLHDTSGLKDEPRKKIIKQVEEGKIEPSKIREVVRKVKEFKEPEQQLEILEDFEKQEDFSREAFDTIIQKKKEISEGIRQPEVHFKEDPYERDVDELKDMFDRTTTWGYVSFKELPKVHYDRAVKITIGHVAYWLKQLIQLSGDESIVDEVLKKVKSK